LAPTATIRGNVQLVNRAGVGPVHGVVQIEDVTVLDAPSRVLATAPISLAASQWQAPFELRLGGELDAGASYVISAKVEGTDLRTGQSRVFGTTTAHPWQPGRDIVNILAKEWL
jgi:uncharacterized lipoprotein YbaY